MVANLLASAYACCPVFFARLCKTPPALLVLINAENPSCLASSLHPLGGIIRMKICCSLNGVFPQNGGARFQVNYAKYSIDLCHHINGSCIPLFQVYHAPLNIFLGVENP